MPQFEFSNAHEFLKDYSAIKRPKEITCFSFDDDHNLRLDESGVKYYYTPKVGVNLSSGFETFRKLDDSRDDHLEALLKALLEKEKKDNTKVEADIITWRGMMTKILQAGGRNGDSFQMNATCFQGTIFIEEDHEYKLKERDTHHTFNSVAPPEVMTYWGYKFETLSVLPAPWANTTREFIEGREHAVVDNHAQYVSVVATGVGDMKMILAGEVDAIWDAKPASPSTEPINWVELKTMATLNLPRDAMKFESRLEKWWAQSFLLGVPNIIVGFRSNDRHGTLQQVKRFETTKIPEMVAKEGNASWSHRENIGFMKRFLEFLKTTVTEGGVWKIRREGRRSNMISCVKVEEEGTGGILSEDFLSWRCQRALPESDKA